MDSFATNRTLWSIHNTYQWCEPHFVASQAIIIFLTLYWEEDSLVICLTGTLLYSILNIIIWQASERPPEVLDGNFWFPKKIFLAPLNMFMRPQKLHAASASIRKAPGCDQKTSPDTSRSSVPSQVWNPWLVKSTILNPYMRWDLYTHR